MLKSKILAPVLFLATISATALWFNQNPPGVTIINPARPPKPVLEEAELEKLITLQNTQDVFLLSGVSPDDSTIVVGAGPSEDSVSGQVGWMNIQTGELEPITLELLKLFPQSQVAWSDNQTVVYLSNSESGDPFLVTLHRASGEIESEALPFDGRPLSLAPNGSRALVEVGSGMGSDLMVSNLETGKAEKLLSYPNGGGPQSIAWTEDGNKLAFVRYEVPPGLASNQARINEIVMQDALGKLPLEENPVFAGNVVDVFDLGQGVKHQATLRADTHDGYLLHKVVWSPDGQRLIVRMVRPSQPAGREHPVVVVGAFPDRAIYRVYNASLTQFVTLDRSEIEAPLASQALFVSPDEVIVIAAYGLSHRLFYFNLVSGEFRLLSTGDGTFVESPHGYQVHAAHQSRQLIYNQSSFQYPSEIYRIGLDGSVEPQALSYFNAKAVAANQIRVDEVSFQLDENTTRIGYLLLPADASFPPKDTPIVIYQQGGPGGAMTNRWGATAEEPFSLLPNFGIGLLFMPFSGREGFGPEFFRALVDNDNFGQVDVEEGAQAARYLLENGYVQPGAVGVTGCSYGGYFVAQSITQFPDLYAAANVQCAVLDMARWWEPNPFLVSFMEGSVPADQMEEYRRDSPLYSATRVRTPLLLFHGMEDDLPIGPVQDFRNKVEGTGTPVELLAFKNEGHSLAFAASKLVAAQQQIVWFRKYLGSQLSR